MTEQCFICDETNPNRLQTHHIVPDAYGGSDTEENKVRLCAGCHQAVEKMYNRRFYDQLGVKPESEARPDDTDEAMAEIDTFGVSHRTAEMAQSEGHELGGRLRNHDTWESPKIAEEICWLVARRGLPIDAAHRRVRSRLIEQAGITEERFVELRTYAQMQQSEGG